MISLQGQNEFLRILKQDFQRDLLDQAGQLIELRSRVEESYKLYSQILEMLNDLKEKVSRLRMERDFLEFRIKEVSEIGLSPDEVNELKERANRLRNLEKIKNHLNSVLFNLYSAESSAFAKLGEALRNLQELSSIDSSFSKFSGELEELKARIYEIYAELSRMDVDVSRRKLTG
jgi:DNA repair protein RecN (Recombination protein N)